MDEDQEITDHELFDTTHSVVEYHRSKDMKRVTITLKDPDHISEMKLYLLLCIETEKLERRLGICESNEEKH